MKTKIFSLILAITFGLSLNAQIDRSKQPEPGPSPKISVEKPQEFQLNNGLKVLLVENHKLPRVSYSLRIDNKPAVEGEKSGVSSILSAMLGNGTTSISKDDFNDEVDFLGANINFGSSSAFARCLSKYADRILKLMADAAINPLFSEEEFEKEKAKLIDGLKTSEKSVSAVARRVSNALSYGVMHPSGEFTTEETVNNITMSDVVAYYKTHFNPENAYLVVVGDINISALKSSVEENFGSWTNSEIVDVDIVKPMANAKHTQVNFVDMPNAVQSNIIVTNNVNLKLGDDDYHAALIANSILGGGATGYLFQNLRDDKAYTYGSYSSIGASRYGASRFSATAEVRNEVTDSSVVEMLKEVDRIRTENVTPETLERAKASYLGRFVMALERPQTVANFAMNIKLNNLSSNYYENFLTRINEVTAEDVKRVSNKYFKKDNTRIIVVGKGSDVIENLEKTGIPIKYFDKYANAIDKPKYSKPIPEGVTAQSVIDNYIKAIGGKDKAMAVNTKYSVSDVTIEGAPFSPKAEIKQMAPNKESLEMSIEGMGVIMKQKFNGESGYMEQQGQRKEIEGDKLVEQKNKKVLFPELYYDDTFDVSLESLTTIDGKDVYKIKIEKDNKTTFKYYNTETGLLARDEKTDKNGEAETTTIVDYSKYSSVNGVKFPYYMMVKSGPQTIIFNTTKITVNEGVIDTDFN